MPDHRLAVIIPFFQREPGILARALESIRRQQIPDGWLVEIIIVDDGSPYPADEETENLTFDDPLSLRVIRQEHSGVAAARNRALDEVDEDTALIAFLDSDDEWPATYLERMIRALTSGFDFCFTDSRRTGHYESYLRDYASESDRYIAMAPTRNSFRVITPGEFLAMMLGEFPAQVSTVVYKRCIAPDLRFDTRLKAAGEDLLFLCTVASLAGNVAFDQRNCVKCGEGLNMYHGNLSWNSPKRLAICVDQLVATRLIKKRLKLSTASKSGYAKTRKYFRRELAFYLVINIVKLPNRVPKPVYELFKNDASAAMLLPIDVFKAGLTLFWRSYMSGARRQLRID